MKTKDLAKDLEEFTTCVYDVTILKALDKSKFHKEDYPVRFQEYLCYLFENEVSYSELLVRYLYDLGYFSNMIRR